MSIGVLIVLMFMHAGKKLWGESSGIHAGEITGRQLFFTVHADCMFEKPPDRISLPSDAPETSRTYFWAEVDTKDVKKLFEPSKWQDLLGLCVTLVRIPLFFIGGLTGAAAVFGLLGMLLRQVERHDRSFVLFCLPISLVLLTLCGVVLDFHAPLHLDNAANESAYVTIDGRTFRMAFT